MDCKNALVAEHGSIEKAVDWLRKKGMASAGKKAGRSAAQGLITIAINDACNTAAILEVSIVTDRRFRKRNTPNTFFSNSAVEKRRVRKREILIPHGIYLQSEWLSRVYVPRLHG